MQHSKIVQANSKGPKSSKIALWKNDAPFHTFPMSCQICSSPPPSFQLSWGPLKACPRHSLLIMKDIIMRPNETSREPKSSSFLFKIPPKCVCVCVVSVKLLVVSYLRNKKSRWARSVGDIVCVKRHACGPLVDLFPQHSAVPTPSASVHPRKKPKSWKLEPQKNWWFESDSFPLFLLGALFLSGAAAIRFTELWIWEKFLSPFWRGQLTNNPWGE